MASNRCHPTWRYVGGMGTEATPTEAMIGGTGALGRKLEQCVAGQMSQLRVREWAVQQVLYAVQLHCDAVHDERLRVVWREADGPR